MTSAQAASSQWLPGPADDQSARDSFELPFYSREACVQIEAEEWHQHLLDLAADKDFTEEYLKENPGPHVILWTDYAVSAGGLAIIWMRCGYLCGFPLFPDIVLADAGRETECIENGAGEQQQSPDSVVHNPSAQHQGQHALSDLQIRKEAVALLRPGSDPQLVEAVAARVRPGRIGACHPAARRHDGTRDNNAMGLFAAGKHYI